VPLPVRAAALPVALLTALTLTVAGCGGDDDAPSSPAAAGSPTTAASAAPRATPSATPAPAPAGSRTGGGADDGGGWAGRAAAGAKVRVQDVNLIARATAGSVKVYRDATGTGSVTTLRNPLPSGAPLVFLAQERRGDRVRVLLPVRPNGSQGWVRATDVTMLETDYRLAVSTGRHELTVYRAGRAVLRVPVGLGTGTTPTPGGVFYLKELLRPRDPKGAYGPFAYGLSGYSEVLDEFLGGDGEIGIHGTNDPGSVGRSVSHGCIRLRNADITKLTTMLPLGTPVQITR
jgi:lipoprotein-anchoring transpeptidase ErfK/SrfK